ncbi:hypothetical protein HF086_010796 [Spodoptera exigua]|uniref:Uncharacterized protein n=1 Tax=Spodoptera exigua TaxID=7107 RepID=A0A922LZS1_SPOEX|nr:hypothetical protein HF086_010796 [Spodoptera exigua]
MFDDALAAARPRPPQHSSNIQLFARVRDSRRSVPSVQIPSAHCAPTAVRLFKPRSHGTCFIDIAIWMPKYKFGVWCVVGSPVWKPRDMSSSAGGGGGGGAGAGGAAPTTLPRSTRAAPRPHHLSASRKSLAPDHRH